MSKMKYQQLIVGAVLSLPLLMAQPACADTADDADSHWASSEPAGCKVWIDVQQEASASRQIKWTGACQNDKAVGKGSLTVTDDGKERLHFDGEMQEGNFHSDGVLKTADHDDVCTVRGSFVRGEMEGQFEESCQSGTRFAGRAHRGQLAGFGRVSLPRAAYESLIADAQKRRLGAWQGQFFLISGWWEGGSPQLSCASEADCLPLVAKRKAAFAQQAQREAKAGVRPYLLMMQSTEGNAPMSGMPYAWSDAGGKLLSRGVVDNKGRAFIVPDPAGGTSYRMSLPSGYFWEWEAQADCWQRPVKALQACMRQIRSGSSADDEFRAQQKAAASEQALFREKVGAWTKAAQNDPASSIDAILAEHRKWSALPQARITSRPFTCQAYQPALSLQAELAFAEAATLPAGNHQKLAYVEAAQLGNWRAAARLASLMLDDEMWEDAMPMIQWLASHQVPAAYNKLADVLQMQSTYDGETASPDALSLIDSLRWRAALQGDPVAQIKMARWARANQQDGLADSLRDCAVRQNPELAE
ncbi:hypothetical protein [Aquitalea aquatica]|uniref:MORN repeat protein n=1 Tax=Aquitalea aquatica TaxID=3044273 RepID=A0A838Y167_9NEIS|nr:hypothetical protein [Aquitalea magnusonii]MBA4709180.1 hypothetical protein [Aquitalea magnusonii]